MFGAYAANAPQQPAGNQQVNSHTLKFFLSDSNSFYTNAAPRVAALTEDNLLMQGNAILASDATWDQVRPLRNAANGVLLASTSGRLNTLPRGAQHYILGTCLRALQPRQRIATADIGELTTEYGNPFIYVLSPRANNNAPFVLYYLPPAVDPDHLDPWGTRPIPISINQPEANFDVRYITEQESIAQLTALVQARDAAPAAPVVQAPQQLDQAIIKQALSIAQEPLKRDPYAQPVVMATKDESKGKSRITTLSLFSGPLSALKSDRTSIFDIDSATALISERLLETDGFRSCRLDKETTKTITQPNFSSNPSKPDSPQSLYNTLFRAPPQTAVSEKDQIDFIARVVSVVCGYDSTLATTMAASAASLKIMYDECANPRKPTFAKAMVKDFVQLLELVINKKTAPAAGSDLYAANSSFRARLTGEADRAYDEHLQSTIAACAKDSAKRKNDEGRNPPPPRNVKTRTETNKEGAKDDPFAGVCGSTILGETCPRGSKCKNSHDMPTSHTPEQLRIKKEAVTKFRENRKTTKGEK